MTSNEASALVWYLARDGQQYGPISEAEFDKLVELGHLREDDLVWNQTFADWQPAALLLGPARRPPEPKPTFVPPATHIDPDSLVEPTTQGPRPETYRQGYGQPSTDLGRDSWNAPGARGAEPSWGSSPAADDQWRRLDADPQAARDRQRFDDAAARASTHAAARGVEQQGARRAAFDPAADHDDMRIRGGRHGEPYVQDPRGSGTGRTGREGQPGQSRAYDFDSAGSVGQRAETSAIEPQARGRPVIIDDDDDATSPRRRFPFGALAAGIVGLAVVGGAGWFAFENRESLMAMITDAGASQDTPIVRASRDSAPRSVTAPAATEAPPLRLALLESPAWETARAAFPDWTARKLEEVEEMRRSGQQDDAMVRHLVTGMAGLRRQYAREALSASPERLRSLASAFLANLRTLTARGPVPCYDYISRGETSPRILELINEPEVATPIYKQMDVTITAIVAGREQPQTYMPPNPEDFRVLSQELQKMGWTNADMTLFGDPQALSRSDPAKVCQLVTDWFTAQLLVQDDAMQARLLVQSLRPVVAG
ncbi:MAG: GYF domain-containing protein [Hyphomicrobiaceae bacterium]